jgi:plasmid maintenance system antidote protein VapI
MKKNIKSFFNVSPSDYICRELKFYGWKRKDLGKKLGLPQTEVDAVIDKKQSISENMAKSLEKAFGESAEFWLNIDKMYWNRLKEEAEEK